MFSLIKKVISSFVPWGSDPVDDFDEDERTILESIKRINCQEELPEDSPNHREPFGQSETVHYDVETFACFHRTGKVTHLCRDYGLIDNIVYFEPNQVSPELRIKKDDEVVYSAYKARENEAERVYKVYALKNDLLELNLLEFETESNGLQKTGELSAMSRVITGRVTQRRGREVYIETADIWCNLDKITASYVPVEGDWVELQVLVKVDEEANDLSGGILEVRSLKPLLSKSGFGRVTFWSEARKEGAIENLIYFTQIACEGGYIPSLGDKVVYDAVESDQERFRWRALVVLSESVKESIPKKKIENGKKINGVSIEAKMSSDTNGISVRPSECTVEVEFNEKKTIPLEVTNHSTIDAQFLVRTVFRDEGANCQLKLMSPKCESLEIFPGEIVTFEFECEGKSLGLSTEEVVFHFRDFTVTRLFEINVTGNKDMNKLLECKIGSIFEVAHKNRHTKKEEEADIVMYGPKPWKPPKFLCKERKCLYNFPKHLWKILEINNSSEKTNKALLRYAPYLKGDLNYSHYADRFHTLLFLEEIEIRMNFRQYYMSEVFLSRSDKYLCLEVPGLVEKRPSIVVGDKIIVTQPWSENDKVKHVGYIHKIHEKEIFVKFNAYFHNHYDESECDVYFEPSLSFFSKAHDAVNRALKVLGGEWLFPSAVNEKPPQIIFNVAEKETPPKSKNKKKLKTKKYCCVAEIESDCEKELMLKTNTTKTLSWVNEKLNERQKLAVINVLKGQGKPLPYIIFGPPGTGKTVTMVELIVQLYKLMPESRILITTPSNSAADLICERLIDAAHFEPGQLVRLVALYRAQERLVPPKLVPYSTYFTGKDDKKDNSPKHVRSSSVNEFTGHHRITVSTCAAISILHYQGLPTGHFTHILVDEAGQTSEPEVLLGVTFLNLQSGQVVLTGDPQQLGPVIYSRFAQKFGLDLSLLQRLISSFPYAKDLDGFPDTSGFDPRFITKLNVNYRSVPEILSLPNQMFYNSDLIPTVSQTKGREADIIRSFNFQNKNRKTPAAMIFHGIIGQNYKESDSPSWFNPHEIWETVFYLRKLYSFGLKSSQVGVLTPYSKQVHKLKQLLQRLNVPVPKIGSVEEFQGQERYVIIVSVVRSSPKYVPSDIVHSLGFVASPQRLNVALTRARALLIILGNPNLLSKDPHWVNVIKYCVKNNSYTGVNIDKLNLNVETTNNEKKDRRKNETPKT